MTKRQIFISIILSIIGLTVRIAISKISNKTEAWDSTNYFSIGLPIMFAASGVAGFIEPKHRWRWGLFVVVLQPIALFGQGEVGPFAILGVIYFLFYFLLASGCAFLGNMIRRDIGT